MTDEHFIVWMRTAGLPQFRKLWGRIENANLQAGDYQIDIDLRFDVTGFNAKKNFVISTANSLGGKNFFLAYCYLFVGSLCFIFALVFCIVSIKKHRD